MKYYSAHNEWHCTLNRNVIIAVLALFRNSNLLHCMHVEVTVVWKISGLLKAMTRTFSTFRRLRFQQPKAF